MVVVTYGASLPKAPFFVKIETGAVKTNAAPAASVTGIFKVTSLSSTEVTVAVTLPDVKTCYCYLCFSCNSSI